MIYYLRKEIVKLNVHNKVNEGIKDWFLTETNQQIRYLLSPAVAAPPQWRRVLFAETLGGCGSIFKTN